MALLIVILFGMSASTVLWTLKEKTPPSWDPADHISTGYDYYRSLAHRDFRQFRDDLLVAPRYYAPLVHLAIAGTFLGFKASRLGGLGANFLSLAILLWSVSAISRMVYSSAVTREGRSPFVVSVLPALLVASYHFSAWLLHDAFLDYPLVAIVAASFALLIRAGDFQRRGRALLFGVVIGLGMLTKQTFPMFMVLPAIYVVIRVFRNRDRRAIWNLIFAGALGLAIAAIWYVPHFHEVVAIYRVNRLAAISENEAPLFSLRSNVFYFHNLLSTQTQLPFGVLFLVGLVFSLIRRRGESVMLYLWLFGGLLSFTLIANKDIRYTVPVLPAAAVLSISWLAAWQSSGRTLKAMRTGVVVLIGIWCIVSFVNAQWPRPGPGYYIDTPQFRWMVFARNYFGNDHYPNDNDWGVPRLVKFLLEQGPIEPSASTLDNPASNGGVARAPAPEETVSPPALSEAVSGGRPAVLGVVVNLPYLNPSSVALYARLMAREPAGPPVVTIDWLVADSARDRLESCDYLLVRTGLDRAEWVGPLEREAEEIIRANPARFTKVASFPIPLESAEAVLYRSVAQH